MEKIDKKEKLEFDRFMKVIRRLRSPDGCPWDREQTHESLIPCMLEEAYEVVEAIKNKDKENLKEELGDVLLQVALHSVIGEEAGEFSVEEVLAGIREKMIRRHPHVFADLEAGDSGEVLNNWEEIKRGEHKESSVSESILHVPRALPANIRAEKIQKKAAKAGFEFAGISQVWEKINEEQLELKAAIESGNTKKIEEELGDCLFTMINLSRFLGINAENSLTNATDKFINRFVGAERIAKEQGLLLEEMEASELDVLWRRIKKQNKDVI